MFFSPQLRAFLSLLLERKGKRNVDVGGKHPDCLPYLSGLGMGTRNGGHTCLNWGSHRPTPGWGSNPQPRRVPQVGIEPSTFLLWDKAPTNWATPAKAKEFFKCYLNINATCPGQCGRVDWVLTSELKGCWFDSQSGHMPGLRTRFPVGGTREATTHWYFSPCLSPSLPLCISK